MEVGGGGHFILTKQSCQSWTTETNSSFKTKNEQQSNKKDSKVSVFVNLLQNYAPGYVGTTANPQDCFEFPKTLLGTLRNHDDGTSKNNRFNEQNNNSARASRFFVQFFAFTAQLRREMTKF